MAKRFKVQKFQEIYKARWFGSCWGASAWRAAFGNRAKLPQDERKVIVMSDDGKHRIVLTLTPIGKKGVKRHRVFVMCPTCEHHIPAGRIHQHTC